MIALSSVAGVERGRGRRRGNLRARESAARIHTNTAILTDHPNRIMTSIYFLNYTRIVFSYKLGQKPD